MNLALLRGHRTIGGSILHVEQQGRGVLLDFGVCFKTFGNLYEEFNKPRAAHGLLDFWRVGLVPHIAGIYRQDLHPLGVNLGGRELPVEALLLSHAHQDHMGLVSLLRSDLPLHCSSTTAAIMKSIQTTGSSDVMSEITCTVPRIPSTHDGRALSAAPTSHPAQARPLIVCDSAVHAPLIRFWNSPAQESSRARQIIPAAVAASRGLVAGMSYSAHPVDHSIYGACAFTLETDSGLLVYSGDLRLAGARAGSTQQLIERMTKTRPDILVIEGTTIHRRQKWVTTERDVFERALEIVYHRPGRLVIADYAARHVERAQAFLEIAAATNRQLVVSTKDMHLYEAVETTEPHLNLCRHPNLALYDEVRCSPPGWERDLRLRYLPKLVTSTQIHSHQGDYILAGSYWDVGELISIAAENPVWVYAGSEAYSEDGRVDLFRLSNWISILGAELHGFQWTGCGDRGCADFDEGGLNASGHIDEESLKELLLEVKPRVVIPNHTSCPEWFCEVLKGEPCEVLTAPEGECLTLNN